MPKLPLRSIVTAGSLAIPLLVSTPGWAQFGGGGAGSNGFSPPVKGGGAIPPPNPAPPPGLPGAAGQQPAAPPQTLPTDLPPTDALFDAIDRGDMPAARDALARGADLNGVNVLGMTPLEMSVDLSRNDITFLLLSLRGASSTSSRGAPAPPGKPGSGKAAVSNAAATSAAARLGASVSAQRPVATAYPEQARPKPRYASSEANAANPQAGFLGFGGAAQP